ncbi:uncharacterized protein LOC109821699 [Asparagus officinalis]|uniref:uncharacterized protein LOC109821699 n=1 Tax=Asparagus officinalis TaxID=4686 RepID=UPI00098E5990|nr:uncharacterized protein LOC109821699 [Asparagus officinalis]
MSDATLDVVYGARPIRSLLEKRVVATRTDGDAVKELDEMKKRLKEMEDEAAALREMQAKIEKEMGGIAVLLKNLMNGFKFLERMISRRLFNSFIRCFARSVKPRNFITSFV